MRAFSLFYKILRKYFVSVIMYVGIFLLIFGMIAGSYKETSKKEGIAIYRANIAVFDDDKSLLSKALTDYIGTNNDIVAIDYDEDTILDSIYGEVIDYAVVIPEGFERKSKENDILNLKTYVSENKVIVENIDMMIESFMTNWELNKAIIGEDYTEEELRGALSRQKEIMNTKVEGRLLAGEKADAMAGLKYFFTFLDYIMIAIPFLVIGSPIITMEKPLMKRRDVVSGFSLTKRSVAIFVAAFLSLTIIWTIMVAIAFKFTSMTLINEKAVPYMIFSSFIHMLSMGAFAMLLAHIFPTDNAMSFFSTILSLLLAFSSGIFMPREFLWEPFHNFSKIFPPYWDVTNQMDVQAMIVGGRTLAPYYKGIIVMALMGLIYLIATVVIRHIGSRDIKE